MFGPQSVPAASPAPSPAPAAAPVRAPAPAPKQSYLPLILILAGLFLVAVIVVLLFALKK